MNSTEKGRAGEQSAADFLQKEGFTVLDRNFRTKKGEIDIIADKDGELSFVEVKAWKSARYDSLEKAVDKKKQQRIIYASKVYLMGIAEEKYSALHYDIVFIDVSTGVIDYIKNAFTETNSRW